MLNSRDLEPHTQIRMSDGSTAEVVENPNDGMWLLVRFLSSESDPSLVGTEDMVLAPEVVEVIGLP